MADKFCKFKFFYGETIFGNKFQLNFIIILIGEKTLNSFLCNMYNECYFKNSPKALVMKKHVLDWVAFTLESKIYVLLAALKGTSLFFF